MNRLISYIFLVLALSAHLSELSGQQIPAIQQGERVIIICDRNLYIAGERLFFSAFLQTADGSAKTDPGRVLYCEIISPDGNKITGDKYLIENSRASGSIAIPVDIITGIYYLRAYTRFMRNAGPSAYYYTRIKVVNATGSEVQTLTDKSFIRQSFTFIKG